MHGAMSVGKWVNLLQSRGESRQLTASGPHLAL